MANFQGDLALLDFLILLAVFVHFRFPLEPRMICKLPRCFYHMCEGFPGRFRTASQTKKYSSNVFGSEHDDVKERGQLIGQNHRSAVIHELSLSFLLHGWRK